MDEQGFYSGRHRSGPADRVVGKYPVPNQKGGPLLSQGIALFARFDPRGAGKPASAVLAFPDS